MKKILDDNINQIPEMHTVEFVIMRTYIYIKNDCDRKYKQ